MDLEFEWDEGKRLANIEKHGVDFQAARLLFDGRPVHNWKSPYVGEDRYISVGQLDDEYFYLVVWTVRDYVIRLISARRANRAEIREYRQVHGEGNR